MPTLTQSRITRYFAFFSLYLSQGIPSGFAFTAIINYLTAQKIDAQVISTFGAVIGLPWGVKFVWGPVIDRFQKSSMGRRRPWVLVAQFMTFLVSLIMLVIDNPINDYYIIMVVFALQGVFMSLQDVCVDAMAIMVVPTSERGRINAFMKGGAATGQAIGAAGLAYLLQQQGFQAAALVQSILILLFTFLMFFIRERPEDKMLSFRCVALPNDIAKYDSLGLLLNKVRRAVFSYQSLIFFGAIASIFIGIRVFQRVYFLHLIQKLGWSDVSISVLSGTYGTAVAVGLALIGGSLSDYIGAKRMLVMTALILGILHISFSLIENMWVITEVATTGLMIRQILEIIFSIAALPLIMALCQRGIEGAQFSIYMALINQADVSGIYISGILFNNYSSSSIGLGCGLTILGATAIIKIVTNSKYFNEISTINFEVK